MEERLPAESNIWSFDQKRPTFMELMLSLKYPESHKSSPHSHMLYL